MVHFTHPFTVYSLVISFIFPIIVWWFPGVKGCVIALFFFNSCIPIDYLSSNTTKDNIKHLKKNGFSDSYIAYAFVMNLATWFWAIIIAINYYASGTPAYFNLYLALKVISTLALVDIYFYFSHRTLHRHFPKSHIFHHCCKTPSFTTNLLFEPLDIFIELAIPSFGIIFYNILVLQDPFAMVATFSVQLAWYILNHDEYAKMPHWKHHKTINTNYFSYNPDKTPDPKEQVRKVIKF